MWGGSSPTTIRHINSFLQLYNIPGGGKAWWTAQEVEEAPKKPGPDMTLKESYRAMMGRRMGKAAIMSFWPVLLTCFGFFKEGIT